MLRERGADDIEDIALNVAGFTVQNLGPGQSQVAMRGVSAGQISRDQPGVKEQVGAYLDDAPISLSLFTPDLDLFDVTRVEVLRGPQGTLFGAGSLSGTVRYITGQPELGVRSMFGEIGGSWVDGGNAGAGVKAGVNVPIGDRTAARVVAYHNQLPGYQDAVRPDFSVDENVNGGTKTGARAALRFVPNERFSITPRVVVQSVKMDGWNRVDAFNILANPFTTSREPVTLGEREMFLAIDELYDDDFVLGDLNLRYDFGAASLTSITSYTWRDLLVTRDGGALYASIVGGSIGFPEPMYTLNNPFYDATTSRVFTQEVRLAGGRDRTTWVVGGFFSSNQRDYGQSVMVSGFEAATGIPTQGLRAGKDELFFSDLAYDLEADGGLRRSDRACDAEARPHRRAPLLQLQRGPRPGLRRRARARQQRGLGRVGPGIDRSRRASRRGSSPASDLTSRSPSTRRRRRASGSAASTTPSTCRSARRRTARRSAAATRGATRRRGTTRSAPSRGCWAAGSRSTSPRSTWTSATCSSR